EKLTHFRRRLLDPQLYMASLDPAVDDDAVSRLAAYPWFHGSDVPQYDSGEHGTRTAWKEENKEGLVAKWTRTLPSDSESVRKGARAAVDFQLKMGCDGIILASPLTGMADQTLQREMEWIEAGLQACLEL